MMQMELVFDGETQSPHSGTDRPPPQLDARAVQRINAIVRGVARYFATGSSTVTRQFRDLDCWTRLRLRSKKLKRNWKSDNFKLRNRHLRWTHAGQ
jgi:hypothetical protein